ncbi:MAG: hypothetical protein LBU07_05105 [Coriobacteriales bacterium]|jgi:hypothetical protein|nr:hypothetical protein [Coriobacteriales bacterium]
MTEKGLYEVLLETGLPVAHVVFKNAPQRPPYVIYRSLESHDMYADDTNFLPVSAWMVELYLDTTDTTAKNALDDVFLKHHITYSTYESYIATEQLIMVAYTMETIGD